MRNPAELVQGGVSPLLAKLSDVVDDLGKRLTQIGEEPIPVRVEFDTYGDAEFYSNTGCTTFHIRLWPEYDDTDFIALDFSDAVELFLSQSDELPCWGLRKTQMAKELRRLADKLDAA